MNVGPSLLAPVTLATSLAGALVLTATLSAPAQAEADDDMPAALWMGTPVEAAVHPGERRAAGAAGPRGERPGPGRIEPAGRPPPD
jgi:hypothetical protein